MPSERAHSCKSIGTREIHTGASLTPMLADQQQLPKGGPRIIPDIPMDLPQCPLTTGKATPYSRGRRTPGHGGVWGNPTQTTFLGREGTGAPSPE